MKKFLFTFFAFFAVVSMVAETTENSLLADTISLPEVTVTSLYRNNVNVSYLINAKTLVEKNHGQEPSYVLRSMPNIYSFSDNGTEFGYGYFRIRGLDQTRINVTLDGMPWNEAEDYGTYFANSPDIMSSMNSIKVERGSSSTNNGTASSGGSISLESVNPFYDNTSYAYIGYGSYGTYKTSVVYNSGKVGKSAFHVKATQQETDGYRDYSLNNSRSLTLKYCYAPNDNHQISFMSLNGHHNNLQGWIGNTKDELTVNKHANGNTDNDKDDWVQSVNLMQYKGKVAESVFLTASAYLQYQKGWYNLDIDNYMIRMYDPTYSTFSGTVYSYGLEHYLYGANVATKIFLDNIKITLGTNFFKYKRNHFMNERLSLSMKNVSPDEFYDNTGKKNDFNAFAAVQYSLGKFSISGNVQYRFVDFRYIDHMNDAMSFNSSTNDTKWNFINYGLNVDYKLNQNNKLYVRYSEVSREPTRTDMFGGNEMYMGEITTNKAERSYDVELGYEVNTDKIKGNLNLYYMSFKNERVLNGEFGLNGLPLHDTADKSYRMGVEASADWNFAGNFHYSLNASFSKNKIKSENFDNKYHILTPSVTLNSDVYYQGNSWKVGMVGFYHNKMYIDQANDYEMPEYLTFNVYGNYRYKNFEVSAHVNNVFNRVNYINAALGPVDVLWVRECGTNVFGDLKIYF